MEVGKRIFVAASGPSLTRQIAASLAGHRVIVVNDAYRLIPDADVLYACDAAWWDVHRGCPDFAGERWSSHQRGSNDKTVVAKKYNLSLVKGESGSSFRTDDLVAYGGNSGFQAVNLAILFGATRIVLVGFDMRDVDGKRHFFGDHKPPLRIGGGYRTWIRHFETAAKALPPGVEIVNATAGSALKCFPAVNLQDELCGRQ